MKKAELAAPALTAVLEIGIDRGALIFFDHLSHVPFDKTFPAYIGPDQGSVDVHDLTGRNLGLQTSLDRAFEYLTESLFAPPLANTSKP